MRKRDGININRGRRASVERGGKDKKGEKMRMAREKKKEGERKRERMACGDEQNLIRKRVTEDRVKKER